ncbi:MAG: PIN domain-containing protein [Bryobacteraceae bacterium]
MTTYLLDTDIAIELLRGRNVHVAEQLASRNRNAIFLSTVTVAELMFGALRSWKPQESTVICRQFCSAFQLVELDQDAGERSGVIRADLESRGEGIGAYDVLIAGIASARGHVLATHNVREFGRVAGLQIEDWAAIP